jgi:dephospho-CoA kinase
MVTIGLTGGIGMGKTTAANLLGDSGLPVMDTDVIARKVVELGQPAWDEIRQVFGEEIVGPDGQLRRDELARQVFSDETRRRQLEAIVHPRIRERWQAEVELWRAQNQPRGVVVIPLLFETSASAFFDTIICIACSATTQRQRLLVRGLSPEQIDRRVEAQWPIEKKIALSHFVIWTEGGLDILAAQIHRILETHLLGRLA